MPRTIGGSLCNKVEGRRIWAQDLCISEAVDITDRVILDGNRMTLEGKLIREIGLTVQDCVSEMPGLVVQVL